MNFGVFCCSCLNKSPSEPNDIKKDLNGYLVVIRALSYVSPLILSYKIHCTSML